VDVLPHLPSVWNGERSAFLTMLGFIGDGKGNGRE
jgi:hypothetical protein